MGVIFSELAVAISAAVIISSILALSLTPMMCSKILKQSTRSNIVTQFVDRCFSRLERSYKRALTFLLRFSWFAFAILFGMMGFAYWLLELIPEEYAPTEDQGLIFARVSAAEGTGIVRMKKEMEKLEAPGLKLVETGEISRLMVSVPGWGSSGTNSGMMIISLAPWQERERTTLEIAQALTQEWQHVPSLRAFAFSRSGLSRGGGDQPVQFVLGGPNYAVLAEWRDIILDRAAEYPGLQRVDTDLRETQPQVMVRIDKNRAASLGVSVQNIGRTLGTMMSEQRITTYVREDRKSVV
jgi:multidrug efflux pump